MSLDAEDQIVNDQLQVFANEAPLSVIAFIEAIEDRYRSNSGPGRAPWLLSKVFEAAASALGVADLKAENARLREQRDGARSDLRNLLDGGVHDPHQQLDELFAEVARERDEARAQLVDLERANARLTENENYLRRQRGLWEEAATRTGREVRGLRAQMSSLRAAARALCKAVEAAGEQGS